MRLDEDEPRSVEAMIHFMYGFSYDSSGSDRGRVSPMLFNVKVYQVGDKYSIPRLKEEAREKFTAAIKTCWEMDDFPVAITEAYSTTSRGDRGLRDPLVQISLEHLDVLLKNEEFKHVLRNILEFAADLVQQRSYPPSMKSYRCPSCSIEWSMGDRTGYAYCPGCGNNRNDWRKYALKK